MICNELPLPPRGGNDSLASSFSTTYAGVVAFIAVVHEGSFARAADRLGVGRSAISRSVQKLETQLDARLFQRTTRSTALTPEGELFYEGCKPGVERIVQSMDELRELRGGVPRGLLRISSATGFGRKVVAPLLSEFQALYPDITIDLMLDDTPTDFTAGRVDVAFRNGRMDHRQVIAKQLMPMQLLVCASPEYVRKHGYPHTIEGLAGHRCINLRLSSGRIFEWEFNVNGEMEKFMPKGVLSFNDPDLVLQAVLNGEGIAQMAGYQICEHLRAGRLKGCLVDYIPDERGHFICYLSRRQLPTRIRVFIDFMTTRIRDQKLHCLQSYLSSEPVPLRA